MHTGSGHSLNRPGHVRLSECGRSAGHATTRKRCYRRSCGEIVQAVAGWAERGPITHLRTLGGGPDRGATKRLRQVGVVVPICLPSTPGKIGKIGKIAVFLFYFKGFSLRSFFLSDLSAIFLWQGIQAALG